MAPARRVKRRLAHQAVHAGFGAQQAKSVFAFDLDGGALDAGRVARGLVFNLCLEALAFGVAQVLAQQHAGPVAGFGAAGAGLDVEESIERVGRVVEHPAKFHLLDFGGHRSDFGLDAGHAGLVVFFTAHGKQLGVVRQLLAQPVNHQHHVFERFLLFAEFLRPLGVVPDLGVFQGGVDFA